MKLQDDAHLLPLVMDAAAGAASSGERLLLEARLAMRPQERLLADLADDLGAALLERMTPESAPPELAPPRSPAPEALGDFRRARAAVELALLDPDAVRWRRPLPGVLTLKLPTPGARLIRLAGGSVLPEHGHTGEERTLVLRGAFEDETGLYEPGDVCFADSGDEHAPVAMRGDDCVCLIVSSGRMRFHGIAERAASFLLWR